MRKSFAAQNRWIVFLSNRQQNLEEDVEVEVGEKFSWKHIEKNL